MGEVVRMEDWRNRKSKQDPLGRGKKYIYKPVLGQEVIVGHIANLLTQSQEATRSINGLRTVQEREQAAIKGMELIMEADSYAKANGFMIERVKNDRGDTIRFNIIG